MWGNPYMRLTGAGAIKSEDSRSGSHESELLRMTFLDQLNCLLFVSYIALVTYLD